MRYFGILLIFNVVVIAGYLLLTTNLDPKRVSVAAGLGIVAGILILIGDRITSFSNPFLGKFTAATEQAEAGAARIRDIESQVAKQRDTIDAVATDALRSRGEIDRVEDLAKGAKNKSVELERLTAEASKNVAALKETTDFSLVLIRFQNDDRGAFDRLIQTAKSGKEPYKSLADQALVSYLNTGSIIGFSIGTNSLRNAPNPFDVNTATIADYRERIFDSTPETSIVILDALWDQARFTWHDRIELVIDVIRTTKSLRVLLDALRLVEKEARLKADAREWPAYIDWWKINESS